MFFIETEERRDHLGISEAHLTVDVVDSAEEVSEVVTGSADEFVVAIVRPEPMRRRRERE